MHFLPTDMLFGTKGSINRIYFYQVHSKGKCSWNSWTGLDNLLSSATCWLFSLTLVTTHFYYNFESPVFYCYPFRFKSLERQLLQPIYARKYLGTQCTCISWVDDKRNLGVVIFISIGCQHFANHVPRVNILFHLKRVLRLRELRGVVIIIHHSYYHLIGPKNEYISQNYDKRRHRCCYKVLSDNNETFSGVRHFVHV